MPAPLAQRLGRWPTALQDIDFEEIEALEVRAAPHPRRKPDTSDTNVGELHGFQGTVAPRWGRAGAASIDGALLAAYSAFVKPGELERRLSALSRLADEAQRLLGQVGDDLSQLRAAIDDLASSCEEPPVTAGPDRVGGTEPGGLGEGGNATTEAGGAQVEAVLE